MKKIVVFTGSGISAESGIRTFRDAGGLWEDYPVEDVATPEAWHRNPSLVLRFYNERRKQIMEAMPNAAHTALVDLEPHFEVVIITQNIDDLHERAGSKKIIHLHGEIMKSRSSRFPHLVYPMNGWEIKEADRCERGYPLRPHIVWFGEAVPAMEEAIHETQSADIMLVIGTSLEVYPAASLLQFAPAGAKIYYVDPGAMHLNGIEIIRDKAGVAVPALVRQLTQSART